MSDPVTLRLDKKIRDRIARIARNRGVSVSVVIRQAIVAWADAEEARASPYELIADLVGIVNGGDSGRSSGTGRRFKEALQRSRSGR